MKVKMCIREDMPRSYFKSMATGGMKKKYIAEDTQKVGKILGFVLLFAYLSVSYLTGEFSAVPLILLISGLVTMFVKTTFPVAIEKNREPLGISWPTGPHAPVRMKIVGTNKVLFEVEGE